MPYANADIGKISQKLNMSDNKIIKMESGLEPSFRQMPDSQASQLAPEKPGVFARLVSR